MKKALIAMFMTLAVSISLTAFTATKLFADQGVDPHYQSSDESVLDLELQYPQGWNAVEKGVSGLLISENGPGNHHLYIAKIKNLDSYSNLEEWKAKETEYLRGFTSIELNEKEALLSPQENIVLLLTDNGHSHYFIRNGEGYNPTPMDYNLFMTMVSNIRFME